MHARSDFLKRGTALAASAALPFAVKPRRAAADDTILIMAGAVAPALYDVMQLVAENVGFFAQEGLNVQQQLVNSPSVAAQLVATGRGDLCAASYEAIAQGYDKGLRLQYFLARSTRFSNVMAVLDSSPIRTIADFKGKNIGVINIGSAGQVTSELMLAGAGLLPSDVTFSPIGVGAQALQALISGHVDGLGYPYGEVVPLEVVGNLKMRVFRHPILKDIGISGFAGKPEVVAAKADLIRRFSRAIVKGAIFVRENPAVSARYFLAAFGTKTTPEALQNEVRELTLLEDDLPAADPSNKRIGAFSLTGLQLYSQILADRGMTKQVVPASAVATNDFVTFANDFDRKAVEAFSRQAR
jgi:NitT/TauT family transport system substrate-binding protein